MSWVWAGFATLFSLIALVRVLLRRKKPANVTPPARGVLMLRPVEAPIAVELANLKLVPQGVESRRADGAASGSRNRKLGHLKAALRGFSGRVVLAVDADVAVDDALVDALLAAVEAGADLAWAAPYPVTRGLARGLLVQSIHSFEVLAAMSERSVCGKAIALGPRGVEALLALPDCIGEDLELARTPGLKVVQAGRALVPHDAPALARFTRWMQVLKAHRPALFPTIPLLFACTPLLALTGNWVALSAVVAVRLVLAAVLERRPGLFVAWLGAEVLLLVCWTRALLSGGRVTWRGRTLRLDRNGALR